LNIVKNKRWFFLLNKYLLLANNPKMGNFEKRRVI